MLPHAKATKNRKHKNSTQTAKTILVWVRKEEKDEEKAPGSAAEPRSAPPCATPVPEGTGVGGGAYFPQVAAGRTQGAHGAHQEHPTGHTGHTRDAPHGAHHSDALPSAPPARPEAAGSARAPLPPTHTVPRPSPARAPSQDPTAARARASAFDEAAGRAGRGKGEGRRSAHAPRPARAQLGSEPGRGAGLGSCQRRGAGRA